MLRQFRNKHCRMVVLLAGAGYGKTTILAQHARSTSHPVLWLNAAPCHLSHQTFVQDLMIGLEKHGWPVPLSGEGQTDIAELIAGFRQMTDPMVLVLDRAHHLSTETWHWLTRLVENWTGKHQLLVAGHHTSRVPIARWLRRSDVVVLGPLDLSHGQDEVHQLAQKSKLLPEDAWNTTQGWPQAVQDLLLHPDHHPGLLVQQFKDRLQQDAAAFLPLLYEQTDSHTWHDPFEMDQTAPSSWLNHLSMLGFPLTRIRQNSALPHPLLRQAVAELAQAQPEARHSLHHALALQAEARGDLLLAVHHHLKRAAPEAAFGAARSLLDQDENASKDLIQELLGWFGPGDLPLELNIRLSLAELERGPSPLAVKLMLHLPEDALQLPDALQAEFYLLKSFLAFLQGDSALSLQHALQGRQVVSQQGLDLRLCRMQVTSLNALNPHEGVHEGVSMLKEARRLNHARFMVKAYLSLAHVFANAGLQLEARQAYDTALQLSQQQHLHADHLEGLYHLAVLLMETHRPHEALHVLKGSLEQARKDPLWLPVLVALRGSLYLGLNMVREALEDFSLALSSGDSTSAPEFRAMLWLSAAECHHRMKNHKEKTHLLERFQQHPELPAALQRLGLDVLQQRVADRPQIVPDLQLQLNLHLMAHHLRRAGLLARLVPPPPVPTEDAAVTGVLKQEPSDHQNALPRWPVLIRSFGTIQISSLHGPVHLSLKRSEELLIFLAIQGASSRNELIQALWDMPPEADNVAHFKVVIRKLRLELAQQMNLPFNPVQLIRGKYALHPALDVQMDVLELMHAPLHSAEHLLSLYQGDFAPRLDRAWADQLREHCQERFVSALLVLTRTLTEPFAAQLLHQGLSRTPEHEVLLEALQKTSYFS